MRSRRCAVSSMVLLDLINIRVELMIDKGGNRHI